MWLPRGNGCLCSLFSIRVGGEIDNAAASCALSDVIQLVAGHGGYIESLDEVIIGGADLYPCPFVYLCIFNQIFLAYLFYF